MEGICLLVLTLILLLLSLDQASLFLSPHSRLPPPGPAFFSQNSVNASSKTQNLSERTASRQARMHKVCKRHNASLSFDAKKIEGSVKRHVWDVVNHLIYCPIAKVASTTWFLNFLAWSNIDRKSVPTVLKQFKESGGRMEKGETNWEGDSGGRGIRTLARCQNLFANSNLKSSCTGTSTRLQRPLTSKT